MGRCFPVIGSALWWAKIAGVRGPPCRVQNLPRRLLTNLPNFLNFPLSIRISRRRPLALTCLTCLTCLSYLVEQEFSSSPTCLTCLIYPVDRDFPSSPTCQNCLICPCRSGFPVVAQLALFTPVHRILTCARSEVLRRRGSHFIFEVHVHVSLIIHC